MSLCLPDGGFECLNQKEINKFCLSSIGENSSISYILQVDLEYPESHELRNDCPLALEKLETSYNMLPNY